MAVIKGSLEQLRNRGLITDWEVPYESILTRIPAAIFFMTAARQEDLSLIWEELERYVGFSYRPNTEKNLSALDWRVEFKKPDLA